MTESYLPEDIDALHETIPFIEIEQKSDGVIMICIPNPSGCFQMSNENNKARLLKSFDIVRKILENDDE